jgi:release factor glutamine methyltransferase
MKNHKFIYNNFIFQIPDGVYPPSEDSILLYNNLDVTLKDEVLEIGAGSGFIAIQIADKVKKIVATDISNEIINVAFHNSKLNNIKQKIDFRKGDLFSPLDKNEKFSLIIFNPPYLPTYKEDRIKNLINKAWDGGKEGRDLIDKFIEQSPGFLKNNGRILLVQSSLSNIKETIRKFSKLGFVVEKIAEEKFFFEKIVVIKAKKVDDFANKS